MSKKTTALISVELVERINKLKRKPDTSQTVIEEAITLLEKNRNERSVDFYSNPGTFEIKEKKRNSKC